MEIGAGYSGPVVAQGKVVTMDYLPKPETTSAEAIERVICLDENTGEVLWTSDLKTHYREVMGSYRTGPRATPTIDEDRIYVVGAVGHIRCLDLRSGKELWAKDSREAYGLLPPVWGTSTAPIIEGDLVIYALAASRLNKCGLLINTPERKCGRRALLSMSLVIRSSPYSTTLEYDN